MIFIKATKAISMNNGADVSIVAKRATEKKIAPIPKEIEAKIFKNTKTLQWMKRLVF